MNYKIIYDEEKLQQFIDWLPDLLPNEQYYIALLARKKYFSGSNLTADKNQLKRVCATKDRIIQKLRQMECEYGSYTYKGEPIRQENLCVYITPNPRDLTKAGLVLMKEIADRTIKKEGYNPRSSAMNAIQVTTSRKIYFDLDIDFSKSYLFKQFEREITEFINRDCLTFIKTNGGLHCLVELNKIKSKYEKTWHRDISNMDSTKIIIDPSYTITMNNDNIIPFPGCVQGIDFSPIFIK